MQKFKSTLKDQPHKFANDVYERAISMTNQVVILSEDEAKWKEQLFKSLAHAVATTQILFEAVISDA